MKLWQKTKQGKIVAMMSLQGESYTLSDKDWVISLMPNTISHEKINKHDYPKINHRLSEYKRIVFDFLDYPELCIWFKWFN